MTSYRDNATVARYAREYERIDTIDEGNGRGHGGANAGIYIVRRRRDGLLCVEKRLLSEEVRHTVVREIKIMSVLRHPNIVGFVDGFLAPRADPPSASLFLDLCMFGSLADLIERLQAKCAQPREVSLALQFHSRGAQANKQVGLYPFAWLWTRCPRMAQGRQHQSSCSRIIYMARLLFAHSRPRVPPHRQPRRRRHHAAASLAAAAAPRHQARKHLPPRHRFLTDAVVSVSTSAARRQQQPTAVAAAVIVRIGERPRRVRHK